MPGTVKVMNARIWWSVALSVLGHAALACWLAVTPLRTAVPRPWIEVQFYSAGEWNGTGMAKASETPAGGSGCEAGGEAAGHEAPPVEDRTAPERAKVEEVSTLNKMEEAPKKDEMLSAVPAVAKPRSKPPEKPRKIRAAAVKPPAIPPVRDAASHTEAPKDTGIEEAPQGESALRRQGVPGGTSQGRPENGGTGGDGQVHGYSVTEARFGSAGGPDFLKRALPKYPRIAREMGKEGTVLLRVTIDEQGRPVEVEVLDTAGSGFDEEAVQAVKKSVFTPAKKDGRPVACRALLPVRFVLGNAG